MVNAAATIRHAATARGTADRRLKAAVIGAHGTLTIAEIARVAGVTRQTVYEWLRAAGIDTARAEGTALSVGEGTTVARVNITLGPEQKP
jgi:excisionase family DNA binding protein